MISRLLLIYFVFGSMSSPAIADWFSPKGCEFKVEFPGKLKISKQYIDGYGNIEQAFGGRSGNENSTLALRAEWAPYDPVALAGIDREQYLLNAARAFANFNGLSHVEYKPSKTNFGYEITFRGGKTTGGTEVLYMGKVVLGKSSILILMGGGAASSFPQEGLLEFLASVRNQ